MKTIFLAGFSLLVSATAFAEPILSKCVPLNLLEEGDTVVYQKKRYRTVVRADGRRVKKVQVGELGRVKIKEDDEYGLKKYFFVSNDGSESPVYQACDLAVEINEITLQCKSEIVDCTKHALIINKPSDIQKDDILVNCSANVHGGQALVLKEWNRDETGISLTKMKVEYGQLIYVNHTNGGDFFATITLEFDEDDQCGNPKVNISKRDKDYKYFID